MKPDELNELKGALLQEQNQLLGLANETQKAADVVKLDQQSVGRVSRMDAMQQQAMAIATKRRHKQRLKNITAALARIDNDDYGWCLACDEGIDIRRLQFDPTAALCIRCAEQSE